MATTAVVNEDQQPCQIPIITVPADGRGKLMERECREMFSQTGRTCGSTTTTDTGKRRSGPVHGSLRSGTVCCTVGSLELRQALFSSCRLMRENDWERESGLRVHSRWVNTLEWMSRIVCSSGTVCKHDNCIVVDVGFQLGSETTQRTNLTHWQAIGGLWLCVLFLFPWLIIFCVKMIFNTFRNMVYNVVPTSWKLLDPRIDVLIFCRTKLGQDMYARCFRCDLIGAWLWYTERFTQK